MITPCGNTLAPYYSSHDCNDTMSIGSEEFAVSMQIFNRIAGGLATLVLALGIVLVSPQEYAAHAQLANGQPQKLESETLTVVTGQGRFDLTVEIADEPAEHAIGLMHREEMPFTHGMLFDFGTTRPITMWMKNTPLSLDMIFIKKNGTVAHIAERTEPFSLDTITSGGPVSFVLEIRGGVARLMGLKPGDKLEHRLFEPLQKG